MSTPTERHNHKVLTFIVFILVSAVLAFVQAWPVMLGAVILHGYWDVIPPITYLESVALTWAWGVIWTTMGRTIKVKDAA
jgi:hypothetical protein